MDPTPLPQATSGGPSAPQPPTPADPCRDGPGEVVCLGYDSDEAVRWEFEYYYDADGQPISCRPLAEPGPREPG